MFMDGGGRKKWVLLWLLSGWVMAASAQDTLPSFSVEEKVAGKVIVSWTNPYPDLIQIAVQRSYDSLKKFTTVYSSTSPELPVNGYSDQTIPGISYYYRIFYVIKGGAYFFTLSKKPEKAAAASASSTYNDSRRNQLDEILINRRLEKKPSIQTANPDVKLPDKILPPPPPPEKPFYIKIEDTLYATLMTKQFFRFRDSIMRQTKDTLYQLSEDTILLGIYIPPFIQRTSEFVFTDRDGYIVIKLDPSDKKRYDLVFMEEDETPVLELKNIREPYLILDKTNFYHGGWFKFELRENGKIRERNKIMLARDFTP